MKFDKTTVLVEQALENGFFPGAVFALGDKNGLLYKHACGYSRVYQDNAPCFDIQPRFIPNDAPKLDYDTMFDMASCSKLISPTMIALKMIEDGRICLYDPISRFIDVPEDKKSIEIRHLLTHTSGIKDHFFIEENCETPEKALETILKQPLGREVGSDVEYTCIGYIVLGKILEAVCGKPLDELAREYVFEPLKMKNTCYNPKKYGYTKFAATEYDKKLRRYKYGEVHDENALFLGGVSANAGVFSVIDDLINFVLMLSRRGKTMNGAYLTSAMFDRAVTDYTPGKAEGRGLGFVVKSNTVSAMGDLFSIGSYGHNGFTGTSIYVEKETSFFAVLLTNRVHYTRANNNMLRFRKLFHNTAMAEYLRYNGG